MYFFFVGWWLKPKRSFWSGASWIFPLKLSDMKAQKWRIGRWIWCSMDFKEWLWASMLVFWGSPPKCSDMKDINCAFQKNILLPGAIFRLHVREPDSFTHIQSDGKPTWLESPFFQEDMFIQKVHFPARHVSFPFRTLFCCWRFVLSHSLGKETYAASILACVSGKQWAKGFLGYSGVLGNGEDHPETPQCNPLVWRWWDVKIWGSKRSGRAIWGWNNYTYQIRLFRKRLYGN